MRREDERREDERREDVRREDVRSEDVRREDVAAIVEHDCDICIYNLDGPLWLGFDRKE